MACNHKFQNYLKLERIDFEPSTLIVGTFNPSVEGNKAEWFYGRKENNFWDVLPKIYGENSIRGATPADWKAFCKRHKIAITDLISCIEDADLSIPLDIKQLKTYLDKTIAEKYEKHSDVEIVDLLISNPTIKNVYLTRAAKEKFWKTRWTKVEQYAQNNKLHEQKLITPSRYAFYQQSKYNKLNPLTPISLEEYIMQNWRSKWHF